MDIEEIVKDFLNSKKKCIFVEGDNSKERYRIANELCSRLGEIFVYPYGELKDFKRADPYIVSV